MHLLEPKVVVSDAAAERCVLWVFDVGRINFLIRNGSCLLWYRCLQPAVTLLSVVSREAGKNLVDIDGLLALLIFHNNDGGWRRPRIRFSILYLSNPFGCHFLLIDQLLSKFL